MIKYANNLFPASKISLTDEIGNVCKEHDVDADEVADAIGLDERIGTRFLRSGASFGGSCLPKDTKALIAAARAADHEPKSLAAVLRLNETQSRRMFEFLDYYIDVTGKRVAVLGLAFKPGADDTRGTRAFPVIDGLLDRGAEVVAYDSVAIENTREQYPDNEYADSAVAALNCASGALVVTDWDGFATLDEEFTTMAEPVVIDGRRIIDPTDDIVYGGLTW
jgi:UDPglucose 6-dehydrogenase